MDESEIFPSNQQSADAWAAHMDARALAFQNCKAQ